MQQAGKLRMSLLLAIPRLVAGSLFLTSAILKGPIAGLAIGAAKTGIFGGKTDALAAFWFLLIARDAKRRIPSDCAQLCRLAGPLRPFVGLMDCHGKQSDDRVHQSSYWRPDTEALYPKVGRMDSR